MNETVFFCYDCKVALPDHNDEDGSECPNCGTHNDAGEAIEGKFSKSDARIMRNA